MRSFTKPHDSLAGKVLSAPFYREGTWGPETDTQSHEAWKGLSQEPNPGLLLSEVQTLPMCQCPVPVQVLMFCKAASALMGSCLPAPPHPPGDLEVPAPPCLPGSGGALDPWPGPVSSPGRALGPSDGPLTPSLVCRSAPAVWSTKKRSSRFTLSFSLTEVSPTLTKTLPSSLSGEQPFLLQVHAPGPLPQFPCWGERFLPFLEAVRSTDTLAGKGSGRGFSPFSVQRPIKQYHKVSEQSRKQVFSPQMEQRRVREAERFPQAHTASVWQAETRSPVCGKAASC